MKNLSILFISSLCDGETYKEICAMRTAPSLDPAQRMFTAMVEGFAQNGCDVTCVSALPMGTSNTNKALFERKEKVVNEIRYVYPEFRIGAINRLRDLRKNTKNEVEKWLEKTKGKQRVLICDSLAVMCTSIARKLAQKAGVKTVAYVTDYPSMATSIKGKQRFVRRVLQGAFDFWANRDLDKYDSYILVAEKLKELIKVKKKPVAVIEDLIVVKDKVENRQDTEKDSFEILYGGALCERFGVNRLVDAVQSVKNENVILSFYGSGESVGYIKEKSNEDARIRYCGVVSFDELQVIQRNADLLVNPRPTDEIFSAYSFPSKTLSYMLTGTPVLTTQIPGIPKDYQPYLYWFDKEDAESMAKKIKEIISMGRNELQEKGISARDYAMNNKNHLVQTRKMIEFFERELNV